MAEVILVFAWKGSGLSIQWPPAPHTVLRTPKPSPRIMGLANPMRKVLPRMLPRDREYLAAFYDAIAFVLIKDGERKSPIISDTAQFQNFHAGSLRLSTDNSSVGEYDGLTSAIDETFVNACGAEILPVTCSVRSRLVAASGALAFALGIHGEE